MTTSPEGPDAAEPGAGEPARSADQAVPTTEPAPRKGSKRKRVKEVHEVRFVTYPKLLFIWPLILAGLVFYPFGKPHHPKSAVVAAYDVAMAAEPAEAAPADEATASAPADAAPTKPADPFVARRLEVLGWIYVWVAALVLLTLGVNVDRNQAAFWLIFVGLIWVLGLWLQDSKGFTFFGDVYRWFAGLNVQYDRNLGLALSILMLLPYLLMIGWAYINNRWRITHNEFEHYSFGKMDDSLGRGAKSIRTAFPDVFELLLGLAGTLIVYNATGTKELRRIPHVMFLPFVRQRLNLILERTAITAAQMEEEEDDEEDL